MIFDSDGLFIENEELKRAATVARYVSATYLTFQFAKVLAKRSLPTR